LRKVPVIYRDDDELPYHEYSRQAGAMTAGVKFLFQRSNLYTIFFQGEKINKTNFSSELIFLGKNVNDDRHLLLRSLGISMYEW